MRSRSSASGIDFESVDGTETHTETVVVSIFELSYRIVQDTEDKLTRCVIDEFECTLLSFNNDSLVNVNDE
jgi:hypothetical protein